MNPFVKTYVDQMHTLVSELADTLEKYDAQIAQAQEAREETMRENWSVKRQRNAYKETLDRMPDLEKENTALKQQVTEAVERAKRILEFAKKLSGVIQQ